MDISEYFPSLKEFTNQITTLHFDQEDIDFQNKMALKVGYHSWEDYLKYLFYNFCNIYDFDALTTELDLGFNETNKLIGCLPIIFNKHINVQLREEMQPIYDVVKSFPLQDQNRIGNFEDKVGHIFTSLILDKRKNDPIALEFVAAFEIDLKNQFIALKSNPTKGTPPSHIESMLMPNFNAAIQKYVSPNFYFPTKTFLLKHLYRFLLDEELIDPNDDFEKTFGKKIRPSNVEPTLWLADGTELFYLLYRLNDCDEYVRGQSIDKIANQLFTFQIEKTDNVMRTNFVKAFKKFEDSDYLKKN